MGALVLTRFIGAMLYNITAHDPATFSASRHGCRTGLPHSGRRGPAHSRNNSRLTLRPMAKTSRRVHATRLQASADQREPERAEWSPEGPHHGRGLEPARRAALGDTARRGVLRPRGIHRVPRSGCCHPAIELPFTVRRPGALERRAGRDSQASRRFWHPRCMEASQFLRTAPFHCFQPHDE